MDTTDTSVYVRVGVVVERVGVVVHRGSWLGWTLMMDSLNQMEIREQRLMSVIQLLHLLLKELMSQQVGD